MRRPIRSTRKAALGALAAFAVAAPQPADGGGSSRIVEGAARQVRDVLTRPGPHQSLWPFPLVDLARLGDALLFRAWDGIHGWELWATDGTTEGTAILADLCPGDCSSMPWEMRALLGRVYFLASDGDHGQALWRTDGTREGTELVADLPVGQEGHVASSAFLTEFQDFLYLVAEDGIHGQELWRSDGEPGGILELVGDLRPGPEASYPSSLYVVGETLFFVADDGVAGRELWKSDGTEAGTERVADLCPGPDDCFFPPDLPPPAGPWIFASSAAGLIFKTGSLGDRLWVTDGTAAGTQLIGEFDSLSSFFPFLASDGAVLFGAELACCSWKLWRTDGTPEGTLAVGDVEASQVVGATSTAVYFRGASPGGNPWALWRTDGTEKGTVFVADPGPGTGYDVSLVPLVSSALEGPLVYFPADDGESGIELWRSDGTAEGTFLLGDINPGLANAFEPWWFPNFAAELDGRLLFYAFTPDYRYQLWSTDGSPAGTTLLHPLDLQASAMERVLAPLFEPEIAAAGEAVLFLADDGVHGLELWGSDGTAAGTRLVEDICGPVCSEVPRDPHRYLTPLDGLVFLAADDGVVGRTLWVSDGTSDGTHPVDPTLPTGYPFELTPWIREGKTPRLLFAQGPLYVTDGTPAATYALTPEAIEPSPPLFVTPAEDQVFFSWGSTWPDEELWVTEGLPGDARRVLDLRPGEQGSQPQPLAALGERVIFSADDGFVGREPWVSDGSEAGTTLLLDIRPGPEGSMRYDYFAEPLAVGPLAYFVADDGRSGAELWRTDGTTAGTARVADLNPGPAPSDPRPWAAWDGKLTFSAWDPQRGRELWASDGARAWLVVDLDPGAGSGVSDWLLDPYAVPRQRRRPVVWQDRLVFAGSDGSSGVELWATDGTAAGTVRLGDLHPGSGSSSPSGFTPLGSQLLFGATDGTTGFELWALGEPPPPEILFEDGFETGDTSAWAVVVVD